MNFKCRICGTEFEEKPPADCPVCRQTDFRDLRKQATERETATAELGAGVPADQAAPDREAPLDPDENGDDEIPIQEKPTKARRTRRPPAESRPRARRRDPGARRR